MERRSFLGMLVALVLPKPKVEQDLFSDTDKLVSVDIETSDFIWDKTSIDWIPYHYRSSFSERWLGFGRTSMDKVKFANGSSITFGKTEEEIKAQEADMVMLFDEEGIELPDEDEDDDEDDDFDLDDDDDEDDEDEDEDEDDSDIPEDGLVL